MSSKIESLSKFRASAIEKQVTTLIEKFTPLMQDPVILDQCRTDPIKVKNLMQARESMMNARAALQNLVERGSAMLLQMDENTRGRIQEMIDVLTSLSNVTSRLLTETDRLLIQVNARNH